MKTLPAIAAVSIAMALLLVPLASFAAGSITFSSPASGASYTGSQSYTISGTVSPAPTQPDNVGITVKNPSGQTVDQDTAAVTSGAFSYSTAVGGTSSWTSGTYTITATDSFGATGTTTFTFSTGTTTTSSYNVTKALIDIQGNLTIIQNELKTMNSTINSNHAAIGNLQTAVTSLTSNVGSISTAVTSLTNSVGALTTSVNSITGSLQTLTTDVTNLQNSLTSITNTLSTISQSVSGAASAANTAATDASNAATQATNAANAVSSTQTYVLVVAVLAAITLVLELAILVRKVS